MTAWFRCIALQAPTQPPQPLPPQPPPPLPTGWQELLTQDGRNIPYYESAQLEQSAACYRCQLPHATAAGAQHSSFEPRSRVTRRRERVFGCGPWRCVGLPRAIGRAAEVDDGSLAVGICAASSWPAAASFCGSAQRLWGRRAQVHQDQRRDAEKPCVWNPFRCRPGSAGRCTTAGRTTI